MTHLIPGDLAPNFEAQDQHGTTVSLSQFAGKKVVLYFYPKDDTPGCTAEACSFRDGQSELQSAGYVVLGVSPDSVKSHGKFASKFSLNFSLLADPEKVICQAYGVWGKKKFMGREYDGVHRETFVIGEDGRIERVITQVDTKEATKQILAGA
jgi:peroxiredoxin Q/BCP